MADVYGRSPTVKSTSSSPKRSSSSSSSSKDESGNAKLAAFRESHSSEPSAPKIITRTEEERKANTLISSSVDRANGIDRTKEAIQKLNNEKARAEFEANGSPAFVGASIVPGALPDSHSMYPEGDFRNHINPDQSLVGTVKQKLNDANEKASSYVPSYNDVIAKRDQLEQSNEAFGNKMELIRDTAHKNERVGSAVDKFANFGKGIYEEVDDNPVGIGITTGSMFVGGAALKVGSTAGRMGLLRVAAMAGSGSKMGRGLTITSKAIEPVLGVGGLGLTGYELKDKSAEELGRTTPHLIGGLIGGYYGWNAGSKVVGHYQTMGRTEIKLETITDVEVATGKQSFPLTRKGQTPDALVAEFKADSHGIPTDKLVSDKYGVWHATSEKLPSNVEIVNNPTRPTDVGGMYVSPRLSPAFTRVTKMGDGSYLKSIFSSDPIRPSASRVYVNDITRLPPELRSVKSGQEFMGTGAKPGEAYITPNADKMSVFGSVESEAVVSPKTMLKQFSKGEKYYTLINGRRVPIDAYEVAGIGKKTKAIEYSSKTKSSSEIIENSYMKRGSPLPKVYESMFSSGVKSSSQISSSVKSSSPISSSVKSSSPISSSVKSSSPMSSGVESSSPMSSGVESSSSSSGSSALSRTPGKGGSNAPILLRVSKKPSVPEAKRAKNPGKKNPIQESDAWKYKRTTNKYKSPLDAKVKGGLI